MIKKKFNKDGSVDLIFNKRDFHNYWMGCLIKLTDKKVVVRIRGEVKDLNKMVIREIK